MVDVARVPATFPEFRNVATLDTGECVKSNSTHKRSDPKARCFPYLLYNALDPR
jgi:hypothetical protein